MKKDVIPRFIIWLIIEVAIIIALIFAVIHDGRFGFGFLLPLIGFAFLPEVLKER